jgi:hypothetical protein
MRLRLKSRKVHRNIPKLIKANESKLKLAIYSEVPELMQLFT